MPSFFFTYLLESQIWTNVIFIQTNSFIIIFHMSESSFTCPGLLASGFSAKTGSRSILTTWPLRVHCIFLYFTFNRNVRTFLRHKYFKQHIENVHLYINTCYIHWSAIVLFMFILSSIFVIVCGLFERKRICAVFLSFVYICIAIGLGLGYINHIKCCL